MKLLLLLAAFIPSCSTVIYDGSGHKLAVIFSDAKDVTLSRSANGEVTFAASGLNNSDPAKVGAGVIRAAVAAWGATAIVKQADDTVNAFTGNHKIR